MATKKAVKEEKVQTCTYCGARSDLKPTPTWIDVKLGRCSICAPNYKR